MFSFLKGLFGSSKNTDTIVETAAKGIYNGLNALVFTGRSCRRSSSRRRHERSG